MDNTGPIQDKSESCSNLVIRTEKWTVPQPTQPAQASSLNWRMLTNQQLPFV